MGFFVPREMQQEEKKSQKSSPGSDRLDLVLLVNAKKMELSFEELNELRVLDFIEMVNIYTGKTTGTKKASQADIDKFFA